MTEIDLSVQGDTHAPAIGPDWTVTEDRSPQTSTSGLRYRIRTYGRRGATG